MLHYSFPPIKVLPFSLYNPIFALLISILQVQMHARIHVNATTFTLFNKCTYTIWPAALSGAGTAPLPASATGFALPPDATYSFSVPTKWSGRLWARTLCSSGPDGRFQCATGDCPTGSIQCLGAGANPPATLAEWTLDGSSELDYYDVSLVDGYNLPIEVRPSGGQCTAPSCSTDLNESCPAQLLVVVNGQKTACKSACEAFGGPEYCCSGAYATPGKCKPNSYSQYFKDNCPQAYSYAYDDASSTFTCPTGADYTITFCPTRTRIFGSPPSSPTSRSASPDLCPSIIITGLIMLISTGFICM